MYSLVRVMFAAFVLFASTTASAQDGLLKSYLQSGFIAIEEGRYAEAETLFRAALSEVANSSLNEQIRTSAAIVSLNGLGSALMNQQKFIEAEAVTRRQIKIMELVRESDSSDYAVALNNLGLMLTHQRKFAEAIEIHRKALSLREKYLSAKDPDIAFSLLNLGESLLRSRQTHRGRSAS